MSFPHISTCSQRTTHPVIPNAQNPIMGNIFSTSSAAESQNGATNSLQSHVTLNGLDGLGMLASLPRELRDMVYAFALDDIVSDAQTTPIRGLSFLQAVAVDDLKKKEIDIALWRDIGRQNSIAILPPILFASTALCREVMASALPKYRLIVPNERAAHDFLGFLRTVMDNRVACVRNLVFGEMQRFVSAQSLHVELFKSCLSLQHVTFTISAKQIYQNVRHSATIMTAAEIVGTYQLTRVFACSSLRRITLRALHVGTILAGTTFDDFLERTLAFEDVEKLLRKECAEQKRKIVVEIESHAGIDVGCD